MASTMDFWDERLKDGTVSTSEGEAEWQVRETARFTSGVYKPVPWAGAQWASSTAGLYPHISEDNPMMVAYTPSEEYGLQDRHIKMKPGRFLSRFCPELHPDAVRYWCSIIEQNAGIGKLLFADTPDDIAEVYVNGPSSCMSHTAPDFFRYSALHPTYVYGAGDLAVAYYQDECGHITARTVCWPDKRIHARCYGDENMLSGLLERADFSRARLGEFSGARILAKELEAHDDLDGDCEYYLCPYIDISSTLYWGPDREYFVLGAKPGHLVAEATRTDGCTLLGKTAVCLSCGNWGALDSTHTAEAGHFLCASCRRHSA